MVEVVCLAVSHGFKDVCWTFGYQREDFAHIETFAIDSVSIHTAT